MTGQNVVKQKYNNKCTKGTYLFSGMIAFWALVFFLVCNRDWNYSLKLLLPSFAFAVVYAMATVFAVLIIIWAVLTLLRVFMYDIPNKKKSDGTSTQTDSKNSAPAPVPAAAPAPVVAAAPAADDKQLVAVITAAIAASEGKPASSLRVVSFRRAGAPRWNER